MIGESANRLTGLAHNRVAAKDRGMAKPIAQKLIALVLVIGGIIAASVLAASRQAPHREPQAIKPPLVRVQAAQRQDAPMRVHGYGTVRPSVQIQIAPQVSGMVIRVHPNLVNGGFVRADEELIVIDPAEYTLQVEIQKAEVVRAQVRFEQEKAEAAVARAEWDEMNPGVKPDSPLTLREPQIEQARAELVAAQARLENARLNLRRTRIRAPFDGRIVEESVDVGQSLVAGQAVATMYGADSVEIVVPLEDAELAWITVPQNGYSEQSSQTSKTQTKIETRADVLANFAAAQYRWTGRVVRTEAQIDTSSRMVQLVVEVDDPFALTDGRPPLVPGMFVEVEIHGRTLEGVVPLPRHLVHDDSQVWVAVDDQLSIRPVRIARLDRGVAYIAAGLENGDLVITSALEIATDGMPIQTVAETASENI